jgi:hypothetical protein
VGRSEVCTANKDNRATGEGLPEISDAICEDSSVWLLPSEHKAAIVEQPETTGCDDWLLKVHRYHGRATNEPNRAVVAGIHRENNVRVFCPNELAKADKQRMARVRDGCRRLKPHRTRIDQRLLKDRCT